MLTLGCLPLIFFHPVQPIVRVQFGQASLTKVTGAILKDLARTVTFPAKPIRATG
jgi:hypothetical protein